MNLVVLYMLILVTQLSPFTYGKPVADSIELSEPSEDISKHDWIKENFWTHLNVEQCRG
jgi:hypothetical protein